MSCFNFEHRSYRLLQLNQENLFQIINQPDELDNFYNVRVGDGPTFIETNRDSGDKLYVANRDSGTISVISSGKLYEDR